VIQKPRENFLTFGRKKKGISFSETKFSLIDFYDKIHITGSGRFLKYNDLVIHIENVIQKHALGFTDISLTPIKAVFNLECEILQQLFKALMELQRLQFLPSLGLIHGANTRLTAWENKMQNRETWKLGFLKNNPLPLLFQWLLRFKGAVLSKFSLYFHDTLAQQTTSSDMRQLCSKLQYDHYHKMVTFQRKYDAASVLLVSDNQVSCDTTDYDSFPIIVSCPAKAPSQHETILKMITDTSAELVNNDKIIYKYSTQEQCTYVLSTVESNIYLVLIFDSKKSEKDVFISNFIAEFSTNLRCSKVFISLKNPTK